MFCQPRALFGLLLACALTTPALRAQTNVRAWYAKGQTWVVWDAGASPPFAFSVYRSAGAFASTAQATPCGTPLNREFNATRLKLANSNATWRVPMPDGSTYQLTSTEGLFVYTPHAAANEYFAVVTYGTTTVPVSAITTNAVVQSYDPVNDPVQCHVQLQGTLPVAGQGSFPYTVYAMWVDGRDDVNDARPDFPVLANAPKNGAPHMFAIYEPSSLTGLPATQFPATLQLHGGGSWGHYWGWRPSYTYYANTGHLPAGGITIAHDDRVYRAAQGVVSEDSPSYWFGWYSTMPAINPIGTPPDNAVVVPYTLRRLIWIQDWIETHSTYAGRVDPKRISVMGTSMGGFGTHLLCRYKPERFSAGSAFVPVMGNPDTGASIKWLGTSTQNLATIDSRDGVVLRVNDFFSPMAQLSPLRDRAFTRFYRGRQEVDNELTKYGWEDSDIPGQFRALNDLGVGVHLYWDDRDHGPTGWTADDPTIPELDIGEWVSPERTERGEAQYQAKYRADQSYPGIFNDDQNGTLPGRQPDIGNGSHTNGVPWGTWSGYYDWDTTTITDISNQWACTMFLVGQSARSVDNYPGTNATADVSIRKPQQFKPATGASFSWEWRNVSDNSPVQSGTGAVATDDVVVVTGLQFTKDPARRRLTITGAASSNTPPTITSAPVTVATVGVPYGHVIAATGTPAPTLTATGLPGWLALAGNTLTGTPVSAGTFGPITITASNGVTPNATQTFSINVLAPDPDAPINVRAWAAAGQVFVVWQVSSNLPLTFDVYRSATPVTNIAQATLVGRLFQPEWQGDRLKIADGSLTWRVPDGQGGTCQLAANEGLFVFTPHAAGNEYFAVVKNSGTVVTPLNRTATSVSYGYDPVNDPVTCHLQSTGTTTRNYPYSVYAMWADGRDEDTDARPDFPIMANAAKNGAPHVFAVYEPKGGLPVSGRYPAVLCFHGGASSGQWSIWAPESGVTANCGNRLEEGVVVAHDDRVFMVKATGAVDATLPSFWLGWSPSMDPFAVSILTAAAQPVVPYTQRRVMWIQDWLEQRSTYRIDTNRVSLMGNSMGGAGSSMLARRFPERIAAATCYVPPVGFAENTGHAARMIGTSAQNLPSIEPSPAGGVLRMNDYWDFAVRLSTARRDAPFMRFYRGRSEFYTDPETPAWGADTVVPCYSNLNATAWGTHLFWDQRDHSPSDWSTEDPSNPYPDIGQWVRPVLTDRPSRTSIIRYRRDQSFPAFFNDDQNSGVAGRQPSMGDGDPLDGDLWGTWGGYYDWDQTDLSDTTAYWACTVFLTGLSSVSVDNYPGTSAACDVAIRRPQNFNPATGTGLTWRLRRLGDGAVLQSGGATVGANNLVTLTGLTIYKDPARTRLEVYPATQPPALGLGTNSTTVATTLAQLAGFNIPATGPNAGKMSLTVTGLAGLSVLVEYSDDLEAWQPLAQLAFPVDLGGALSAAIEVIDPTTPLPAKRFYRLRLP